MDSKNEKKQATYNYLLWWPAHPATNSHHQESLEYHHHAAKTGVGSAR